MLKSFIFIISLTTVTGLVEAKSSTDASTKNISFTPPNVEVCSGQVKLATILESFQYKRSDSFGVNPPLY